MWTDQQAKFKSTKLYKYVMGNPSSTLSTTDIPSKPDNGTRSLLTIMDTSGNSHITGQEYLYICLDGTGQYENTFWGNTDGDVDINQLNLTNYIHVGDRNW